MPTTFEDLNNDVLRSICEHIYVESPETVFSLLFVSKHLHEIALPFRYQNVLVQLGEDPPSTLYGISRADFPREDVSAWLSEPSKACNLSFIHSLTIQCSERPAIAPEDPVSGWPTVVELVTRLTRLRHIRYHAQEQFPLTLLDAIHAHHPSARIEILGWCRRDNAAGHEDPAELALARSPCLDTVSLSIFNSDQTEYIKSAFGRLISLAPQLKRLRYEESRGGCVVPMAEPDPWGKQCDSSRSYGEASQRQWWRFKDEPPVRKAIEEFKFHGRLGLDVDSVTDYWSQIIDFSRLEKLDCAVEYPTSTTYLLSDSVSYLLPNLRHLSLRISKGVARDDLFGLVRSCPPLETLNLHGHPWISDYLEDAVSEKRLLLEKLLETHAQTVQHLALHYLAPSKGLVDESPLSRPFLLPINLEYIRNTCPKLQSLGIDIDYALTSDEEQEVYAMLATFSTLREVQLYYSRRFVIEKLKESSSEWQTLLPESAVTRFPTRKKRFERQMVNTLGALFVQRVWDTVSKHKAGKSLQRLHVKVADRSLRQRSHFLRPWLATQSVRDDAPRRCDITRVDSYYFGGIHQSTFADVD